MPNLTLAQFDQYVQSGAGGFTIDAFTGISGKSLMHVFSSGAQKARLAVPKTETGVPKGITSGQWSLALKRSVAAPTGMYGVTVGQSVANVIATGACYSLTIARSGTMSNRIRLTKHGAPGISGAIGTELAFAALAESTNVVTLRLIWDLTTGNFEAFQGAALDYSDLVSVLSYTDPTPLTTVVAEGFFVSDFGQNATAHTVWFDNLVLDTFT